MERDEVLRIAKLARIAIQENEIDGLLENFKKILEHFNDLATVETNGIDALFHFEESLPMREDSCEEALDVERLMQNAPDFLDKSFKLPKVIGEAE